MHAQAVDETHTNQGSMAQKEETNEWNETGSIDNNRSIVPSLVLDAKSVDLCKNGMIVLYK